MALIFAVSSHVQTPFAPPFQYDVPPIAKTIVETIDCPSDDATKSFAMFSWRGPHKSVCLMKLENIENLLQEYATQVALNVLHAYLTATAVGPFDAQLVQTEPAVCAGCSFSVNDQSRCFLQMVLEGWRLCPLLVEQK